MKEYLWAQHESADRIAAVKNKNTFPNVFDPSQW